MRTCVRACVRVYKVCGKTTVFFSVAQPPKLSLNHLNVEVSISHITHTHTYTFTQTYTYKHTYIHTHIHILTHTHRHTHTHTHTYPAGLLLTSVQLVAEAATNKTRNKHKRRTFMPSAGLEPASPPIEQS